MANAALPSTDPESTYTVAATWGNTDSRQTRRRSPSLRPMTTAPTFDVVIPRSPLHDDPRFFRRQRGIGISDRRPGVRPNILPFANARLAWAVTNQAMN